MRLSWDRYFLEIAKAVSLRASCPRASSGCVLVDNNTKRILATGYNGAPAGESNCLEVGCNVRETNGKHCKRTIHGEANTIYYADKYNVDYKNTTLYEYFEAHNEQTRGNYYPDSSMTQNLSDFPCEPCQILLFERMVSKVICSYGNGVIVTYII